ncbi:uncharacterized protein [Labrus bergylta]|uniref:uncharacterized protein isoform X1 n=1 Tax=Labrus bergylta TaxID=56723 RepID=UPI003314394D
MHGCSIPCVVSLRNKVCAGVSSLCAVALEELCRRLPGGSPIGGRLPAQEEMLPCSDWVLGAGINDASRWSFPAVFSWLHNEGGAGCVPSGCTEGPRGGGKEKSNYTAYPHASISTSKAEKRLKLSSGVHDKGVFCSSPVPATLMRPETMTLPPP